MSRRIRNSGKWLVLVGLLISLVLVVKVGSAQSDPVDLLIIAPREFVPALRPLAAHKIAPGMNTSIITLEDIRRSYRGDDDPERIKRAIAHYVTHHETKYVMLVGDVNKFPVRWQLGNFNDSNADEIYLPSDFYYADLYDEDGSFNDWDANGNGYYGEIYRDDINPDDIDPYPDVAVGRVPAADITQVEIYVAKVIRYEYLAPDSRWSQRLLLIQHNGWWEHIETKESVAQSFPDATIVRLYDTPEVDNSLSDYYDPDPAPAVDGLPDANEVTHFLNPAPTGFGGVGFVWELSHGNQSHWWDVYEVGNIRSDLRNTNALPVIYSGACKTTQFFSQNGDGSAFAIPYSDYQDVSGTRQIGVPIGSVGNTVFPKPAAIQPDDVNGFSIGEAFVVENDRGSIAYFGSLATGEPKYHKILGKAFFDAYSSEGLNILGGYVGVCGPGLFFLL